MSKLKTMLVAELERIPGVECVPSSLAGLIEFRYKGKSFAHFHNDNELDLRLTKNVIKAKGLSHPGDSIYHPNRSRNSAWIGNALTIQATS